MITKTKQPWIKTKGFRGYRIKASSSNKSNVLTEHETPKGKISPQQATKPEPPKVQGERTDVLGRKRCYNEGVLIPCPQNQYEESSRHKQGNQTAQQQTSGNPTGPIESGLKDMRKLVEHFGGDSIKATDFATNAIRQHLAAGGKVSLWLDGKEIPVKGVAGRQVQDDKGQTWGLLSLAMGIPGKKNGVEFSPVGVATQSKNQLSQSNAPQQRKTQPANQSAILSKVQRDANERDLNDDMRELKGVNLSLRPPIPKQVAEVFDAHGTDTLDNLVKLLNGGIDPKRQFFTSRLSDAYNKSKTGNEVRDQQNFVLLSHPGKTLKEGGIAGVLVDPLHTPNIPDLQQAFPNVRFVPIENAASVLAKVAAGFKPVNYGEFAGGIR